MIKVKTARSMKERWGFRTLADWMRRLRETLIEKHGWDEADQAVPEYLIRSVADAAAEPDPGDPQPAFSEAAGTPGTTPQEEPSMADPNTGAAVDRTAEFAERETQLSTLKADKN